VKNDEKIECETKGGKAHSYRATAVAPSGSGVGGRGGTGGAAGVTG